MFAAEDSGGGGPVPKQAPPWFASQEQYEAFLKLIAMDLGAECISATSIDVEQLDEDRRKDFLGKYALRPSRTPKRCIRARPLSRGASSLT
jgi:hypothetical protein